MKVFTRLKGEFRSKSIARFFKITICDRFIRYAAAGENARKFCTVICKLSTGQEVIHDNPLLRANRQTSEFKLPISIVSLSIDML